MPRNLPPDFALKIVGHIDNGGLDLLAELLAALVLVEGKEEGAEQGAAK